MRDLLERECLEEQKLSLFSILGFLSPFWAAFSNCLMDRKLVVSFSFSFSFSFCIYITFCMFVDGLRELVGFI